MKYSSNDFHGKAFSGCENLAKGKKLWGENYGILSIERVEEQIRQLIDLDVLKAGDVTPADVRAQVMSLEN